MPDQNLQQLLAKPEPVLIEPVTDEERAIFSSLDQDKIPRHVAIIMDGNGRWAKSKSMLERMDGHRAGTESVRAATRTAAQLKMTALTLYAFSSENWSRPKREVSALMNLLETYLVNERDELMENNVKLVASGQLGRLPDSARKKLRQTMELTEKNTGTVLNLALSYGGRQEIVEATRRIAEKVKSGEIDPSEISEEVFVDHLCQPDLPDPELLIRTSGEQRVSNFLLWQIAYTEFVYLDIHWPDFRRVNFLEALAQYMNRDRRFGKV